MGYPAATGRGTSRADVTRTQDLAQTPFRHRNSSGILRRQKTDGASSRSTGKGRLLFSACEHGAKIGERGEGGSLRLTNSGRFHW
jgi:hypothetical protein